ncbi:MAG: hypothetical protein JHD32_04565 [Sphingobium sp.]|nr:hypothetical protein [Sphingobium sp.]
MDQATKNRFRQFADSWNDDDQIDDSGLTGADLKAIAEMIEHVVMVPRRTLASD